MFIGLLILFVAFAVVCVLRLPLQKASLAMAVTLLVGTFADLVGGLTWALFLLVAVPLNVEKVRKQQLTKPMLKMFKALLPEMSRTEQEAIKAGSVWWDAELFSGNPNWQRLHSVPKATLTAEEQAFLDGPVEKVCNMCDEWEIHHSRADLPEEIWQYLKEQRFFAMIIKKEFGGLEFSAYAQSRVLQKLSSANAVLSSTVGVPNSLGPGELLQHYGTPDQQAHYLPRLAKGEEIPCFALTSPEAGSDAGAIPDTGVICKGKWKGKQIVGMRLTFNKRYITLAPVATVIGLAFKLSDPDGLLGEEKDLGITCALLPRDTKGLEIGNRHFPLNVPFQNGPIRGQDIFVPLDYIIGGSDMAGQGWRMLVECLSVGRCITLPSSSAGGVKSLALATGAYARIRRQFKLPIGKMEGIEEMLAIIGGNAYMMDAVTSVTTKALDLGEKPSVISAICKYHLTEKMRESVNASMDVHGGKGIMLGPNNYLGRDYQGAPIAITVEGANILTRNMMIYGQGAMRCHPWVLKEIEAVALPDADAQLDAFDSALFGHIGFTLSNLFSCVWSNLSGGRFHATPFQDETSRYYRSLSRHSASLALMSDVSMGVLGGNLKRMERLSARLGDILSYLYLSSCTLKRFEDEGRQQSDLPLLHWAMQDNLYKLETAIVSFLDNFPNKSVAIALKVLVMPWGRSYKRPSDKIEHTISQILQTTSETRTRLGEGQYLTREPGNISGDLEQVLDDILACEPLHQQICQAADEALPFMYLDQLADTGLKLGVIDQSQAELMRRAEAGRLRVINVDDFTQEELELGHRQSDIEPQANSVAA